MISIAFMLTRLLLALALLPIALKWRMPLFASVRPITVIVLPALTLALIAIELWLLRRPSAVGRMVGVATLLLSTLGFVATASAEVEFRTARERVLNADPQQLERLGRHVIVGYRTRADIDPLLATRLSFGMVNSVVEWYRPGRAAVAEVVDAAVELTMRGLRAAPA